MKKILWGLLSLVLLAVAALAIFILTFDADRFRPMLVEEAEKALGRPVEIGHLSLAFHEGIALSIKGLKVSPPLLELDEADVNVRLAGLLRKEVQVASILYKNPRVRIVKASDGHLNLGGFEAKAEEGKPSTGGPETQNHVLSSMDRVQVENGEFYFEDQSSRNRAILKFPALTRRSKIFLFQDRSCPISAWRCPMISKTFL